MVFLYKVYIGYIGGTLYSGNSSIGYFIRYCIRYFKGYMYRVFWKVSYKDFYRLHGKPLP